MSRIKIFNIGLVVTFFFTFAFFVTVKTTDAQSCGGGAYWCGNYESSCHYAGSTDWCDPIFDDNCVCNTQCVDRQSGQCSTRTTQTVCQNPCSAFPCMTDGCSWNSGPGPTSPPPPSCSCDVDWSCSPGCSCDPECGGSGPGGSTNPPPSCDTSQTTTLSTYGECGPFDGNPNSACTVRKFRYTDIDCDQTDQFEVVSGSCTTCQYGCSGGSCNPPPATPTPTVTPAPGNPVCAGTASNPCACTANCRDGANTDFSCCHRTYAACSVGGACITVPGGGANTCNDGQVNPSCSVPTATPGGGGTIPTNTSAPPPPGCTQSSPACHHECVGTQCRLVGTAGADSCLPGGNVCGGGTGPTTTGGSGSLTGASGGSRGSGTTTGGGTSGVPTNTPRPTASPTPRNGEISGLVSNAATGRAFGNRQFLVRATDAQGNNHDDYSNSGNGRYNITNLESGKTFTVRIISGLQAGESSSPTRYTSVSPGSSRNFSISGASGTSTGTSGTSSGGSGFIGTGTFGPSTDPVVVIGNNNSGGGTSGGAGIPGSGGVVLDTNSDNCATSNQNYIGARVQLRDDDGDVVAQATSDASGYRINGDTTNSANPHSITVTNIGSNVVKGVREGSAGPYTGAYTPGVGYSFSLLPPDSRDIDICVGSLGAWFMTESGNVRMRILDNPVPAGQEASNVSSTKQPVFYSSESDVDLGSDTSQFEVNREYDYNGTSQNLKGSASYSFYKNRASNTGVDILPVPGCPQTGNCSVNLAGRIQIPQGESGVLYEHNGNLTITGYNQPAQTRVTILANGDININANIGQGQVPQGSLLTLAAKRDINIDDTVGETSNSSSTTSLTGILTAERNIVIESRPDFACSSRPDRRINIAGTLIANSVYPFANDATGGRVINQRSLCSANSTYPSLLVKTRFDFVTSLTDFYKVSSSKWSEVRP